MRGKKPGEKLSNTPEAQRARARRERAAKEREADPEDPPADPPAAAPAAPAPADPEPTVPAPAVEPLGDATAPPSLMMGPSSATTRSTPGKPARDSAWHQKWRAQLAGGGGREQACEWGASKVVAALSKLDDITRQCGQDPQVTAEDLRPALVLMIDQMMPERAADLLDRPIAHVVFGVAIMSGQAVTAMQQAKSAAKAGKPVVPVAKPKASSSPSAPAPSSPAPAPSSPPAPPAPAPAPKFQATGVPLTNPVVAPYLTTPDPMVGKCLQACRDGTLCQQQRGHGHDPADVFEEPPLAPGPRAETL